MPEFSPQSPHVYDGDDIIVTIDEKTTLHATNHTLNVDMATNERRTKTTAGKVIKPGDISWSANVDALCVVNDGGVEYTANFDPLDTLLAKKEVTVTLIAKLPGDAVPGKYSGKAFFTNFSLNAPTGEDANYTATLTGSGDLKKVVDNAG